MYIVKWFKNQYYYNILTITVKIEIMLIEVTYVCTVCAILTVTKSKLASPVFPSIIWLIFHACCTVQTSFIILKDRCLFEFLTLRQKIVIVHKAGLRRNY